MAEQQSKKSKPKRGGRRAKPSRVYVAMLNQHDCLIGYEHVAANKAEDRIVVPENCDLPVDGSYKWVGEQRCFLPVGAGFGKPKRPPVSPDYAIFLTLRALVNDTPIPDEVGEYVDWYDATLRERNQARTKKIRDQGQ